MSLKSSNSSKNQILRIKDLSHSKSIIIKLGEALYKTLKASLNNDEIKETLRDAVDALTNTKVFDNSDLPVRDHLQHFKETAQVIADNTHIFSRERQAMKNQLITIYANFQADESLSDDEKQSLLRTILEIRNILQPSSPPRNPPNK